MNSKEEILDQLCWSSCNVYATRAAGLSHGEPSEELQRPGKDAEGQEMPQLVHINLLARTVLGRLKPQRINRIIWICPKSTYQMRARGFSTEARPAWSCRTSQRLKSQPPGRLNEEDILLEVHLRPEQSLGSDSVPDWEELEASVFVGQEPHPTLGHAGSLRVKSVMLPQEDTVVDAVPSLTNILERHLVLNRDLQSLLGFNLPTSQGVAS